MKKALVIFLFVLLLVILTTFVRSYDLMADIPVSFVVFGCFLLGYLKKTNSVNPLHTLVIQVISLLLLYALGTVIDQAAVGEGYHFFEVGFPNFLSAILGSVCGYLLYTKRRLIVVIYMLVAGGAMYMYVNSWKYNWFNFVTNNSFTGQENEPLPPIGLGYNQNADTFDLSDFDKKVTLIDFWNSGCGYCFEEFPQIEQLHKQYMENDAIQVISVNIPLKRDSENQAFEMIDKWGYTFKVYKGSEDIAKQYNIDGYPTIILVKDNKIVFRGNLALAKRYLATLP